MRLLVETKGFTPKGFTPFTGTVDELLTHVGEVDADQVERVIVDGTEDVRLTDADAIQLIMAEEQCSESVAEQLLTMIKDAELKQALSELVNSGLVEVSKYDENGDPLYSLTDNGKILAEGMKNKR